MARSWTATTSLEASPEAVLDLLTDPGFALEQHELDPAVVEARATERSRSETRLVLEIDSTEYARGMTGLDRSKRERSKVTFDWDLGARLCRWTYSGEHGGKVRVWGEDRIEAAGGGSRLVSTSNVEVKIPLLGGQIERLVVKEIERARPGYEALVRSRLAERKG